MVSNPGVVPFTPNLTSQQLGCYGTGRYFTPADVAGNGQPWWADYFGQKWLIPFFPEKGCRVGVEVFGALDKATWPVLSCATLVANTYFNTGANGNLAAQISNTCAELGLDSLEDLYGNGQDLIELAISNNGGIGN